ncbi:MAG: DHH family phosphoesterase [Caldicoprobacterales bacterium]|jgi:c-di-AMP phosphodiesterase-like protein
MKKHLSKWRFPETKIYLAIILFFAIILLQFDYWIGGMAFVVFLILLFYNYKMSDQRKEEWTRYLESLSEDIDWATKNAVLSIPMPLVVIDPEGTITWYNPQFGRLFDGEKLLDRSIKKFVPDFPLSRLDKDKEFTSQELFFSDKWYRLTWTPVRTGSGSRRNKVIFIVYWQDITEEQRIKALYQARKIVIAHIVVDNYDEVLANTESTKRPAVQAEIESRIAHWASGIHAGWIKYERDKYMAVFEEQELAGLRQKKFELLDQVRDIKAGNTIPVTLSIGVGYDAETPALINSSALSAMELALGRGGDQAVVKQGTKLYFYGGRSQGVEKRTKVKSRVIANALRELMEQSDKVLIMSHEDPDLDSIGSALGIYRCARFIGKNARIVLDKSNASVDSLIKRLEAEEIYEGLFIRRDDALDRIDKDTLLVVVDTHRPSFTEAPELLERAERIVVFDHHRRGAESIENATLTYLEPFASSASELITEIVQYFDDRIRLEPLEADALLAGITMDTKNFIFKTGVRTFEAASYLRRAGADPTAVRQLFQDDMETFSSRAETISNARLIFPGVAISQCPPDTKHPQLIAAQAADTLLNIKGIHSSVVLCSTSEGVMISGRSLGNLNMQVILEKLGGGGHLTMAGAQLHNITMEEAEKMVIQAIEEYLEGGNK